jgi:protein O-GlcNAc transferase
MQAWTNLGVMLRNAGALTAAQLALQEALRQAPSNQVILSNLSVLHVLCGSADPNTSRTSFDRALAYDPTNADALYNLGVMEAGDQNYEKAIFYYRTCVRMQPCHALAWNNLGVVYQQVQNIPCALDCYEAAVAAKPDFALALNNLGVLYTAQGHSGKAERHLCAAIAANNKYAEAYNNMGVLLRDRGLVAEVCCLQFVNV